MQRSALAILENEITAAVGCRIDISKAWVGELAGQPSGSIEVFCA